MGAAILKSFAFGALLAGAIGPIALLIFGTGARRGFAAGALAGLGAALADFLYALGAFLAGALLLPLLTGRERAIETACALLLLGLGTWMLAGQLRPARDPEMPAPAGHAFLSTFLLTIVNPLTFVIFAGVVPQLPVAGSPVRAAVLALALALGSAVVNAAIGGAGAALGRALPGERARRAVSAAAAAGIMAFGIVGLVGAE